MPERTRRRPTDEQLEAWLAAGPGGALPGRATVFDLVEELRELRAFAARARAHLTPDTTSRRTP